MRKYSDKLSCVCQSKLDRSGSFMVASNVDKSGFEDGWMEGSVVANKFGLCMWHTDNTHQERLVDQLSTMEQRPHENLVLLPRGTCSIGGAGPI